MVYQLSWISGCPNAWCVMLAMEIKGLAYESQRFMSTTRDDKTSKYQALDPRSKVPVLKDGNTTIYESIAILAYLEHKHPEVPLFGTSHQQTGIIWQRVFEIVNNFRDPLDKGITKPLFEGRAVDEAETIQFVVRETHEVLQWVDNILLYAPYLAGKMLSAADVIYMPFVQSLLRAASREDAAPLNLDILPIDKTYPNIAAWLKRIEEIPGYEKTYPPHWRI